MKFYHLTFSLCKPNLKHKHESGSSQDNGDQNGKPALLLCLCHLMLFVNQNLLDGKA